MKEERKKSTNQKESIAKIKYSTKQNKFILGVKLHWEIISPKITILFILLLVLKTLQFWKNNTVTSVEKTEKLVCSYKTGLHI